MNNSNTLFGYYDEEFTINGIDTPTKKCSFINSHIKDGCVNLSGRNLHKIPFEFINFVPDRIKTLLLHKNKFKNLSFLKYFPNLTTLSLSKNIDPDPNTLPFMPSLRTLHLNDCDLSDLHRWLRRIKKQCPRVTTLSVRSSFFGNQKVSMEEATNRRRTILDMLPTLIALDSIPVLQSEIETLKLYKKWKKGKQSGCSVL